ncbi:MAG: hypothetical protein DYG94_03000 [Leptolyngbya sp. PLA3]|nr:MAG: hypothetical protein EDM82_11300 [Cyanobacteria bacterium CYA]MCE7967697.1 hypothetical protein [Leptolyngbya sp. PL-A3]
MRTAGLLGFVGLLFSTIAMGNSAPPTVVRVDLVAWRQAALDHGVVLLAPGVRLRMARVEDHARGWSAFGSVEGDPHSSFAVSVVNGYVAGGVWTARGAFGLEPVSPADARSIAACAWQALPQSDGPRCLFSSPVHTGSPEKGTGQARAAGTSRKPPAGRGEQCDCTDDPGTIDVLVVYTALARDAAGGLGPLLARIQNTIDATSLALSNSQIDDLTMNLADAREISYDEVSPDWLDHLVRVTEPADGYMDQVHTWRDEVNADCVMLIIDDPRFTGGAGWWALWDQAQAFTCLNWREAGAGFLTGPHEFGHNFGCAHDHLNDASAPFSYSWGHFYTVGPDTYGTIMSYVGIVQPVYSNPDLLGPGAQPLGIPPGQPEAAYNALMIRQSRSVLANYRRSTRTSDCNNNAVDDAVDISSGASLDADADCIPDECEQIVYVDAQASPEGDGSSWSQARADLAEVITAANLRCADVRAVWAAEGLYTPDSGTADPWRRFSMRSGLALYGGFQGQSHPAGGETDPDQRQPAVFPSILSGDIGLPGESADNSFSVVDAYDTNDTAILDGFTIRDGHSFADAGGLYGQNTAIRLRDVVFSANFAPGAGAAAAFYDGSTPTFARCSFLDNSSEWIAGAVALNVSNARFDSCIFSGNTAGSYGGAIDAWNSTVLLSGCLLADNHSNLDGGAVSMGGGSDFHIVNSTLAGNSAQQRGGGVILSASTLGVDNTILWENTSAAASAQADQLDLYSGTILLNHSCVQGLDGSLGGTGNIALDPRFVAPGAGDYSPALDSPCIDAGANAAVPVDELDLDADSDTLEPVPLDLASALRFIDQPGVPDTGSGTPPLVDMGAYECALTPCIADWNSDGVLNFFDVQGFLAAFSSHQPSADLVHDSVFNFFDVQAFLAAFSAGCP